MPTWPSLRSPAGAAKSKKTTKTSSLTPLTGGAKRLNGRLFYFGPTRPVDGPQIDDCQSEWEFLARVRQRNRKTETVTLPTASRPDLGSERPPRDRGDAVCFGNQAVVDEQLPPRTDLNRLTIAMLRRLFSERRKRAACHRDTKGSDREKPSQINGHGLPPFAVEGWRTLDRRRPSKQGPVDDCHTATVACADRRHCPGNGTAPTEGPSCFC